MRTCAVFLIAGVVMAAGCGGGDEQDAAALKALGNAAGQNAIAGRRQHALAVPVGADPLAGANKLMNFAELSFREYFPAHESTRNMNGWYYRYYPQTGVYLAVINWRVYVLGGPFGPEAIGVGPVDAFITVDGPASNQAPTTSLTFPGQGAVFPAGATINLQASAADADGIAKVEFYANGNKIGEDTTAPYALAWSVGGAGSFSFSVKATDTKGMSTTSAAVSVTVAAPTPPASPPGTITAALLSKCPIGFSSDPNSYQCLVGSGVGYQTFATSKPCTLTVSATGLISLSSEGKTFTAEPLRQAESVFFNRTASILDVTYGNAMDYGYPQFDIMSAGNSFFQAGGTLRIEYSRLLPEQHLSCTITVPAI